ncbi:MAG: NYN domain-containing protein [Thermodesulfobacteriota bacterium]
MTSTERVVVFIDGSNFYFGLKNLLGTASIDFYKFSLLVAGARKLIRAYYYNAPLIKELDEQRYRAQQRFFERLKNTPYLTVKLGRLVNRNGVYVEKGVDINIAVDMLRLAQNNAYDTAILVSGDGDFVAAVEGVKDIGKHVEHAYFKSGQSQHLRQACDKYIELSKPFLQSCLVT